jgi:HEPN domain-containing protein
MPELARELAQEWLVRAEHDLRVAEYLLTMPDPPPESIGFHAQQCVEKALKGFLTLHQIPFERRHDLNYLIDLCAPLDPAIEQFRAGADELTPYAVEFRYPDALPLMPLALAQEAVRTARRIYTFATARMK